MQKLLDKFIFPTLFFLASSLLFSAAAQAATYSPGFTWDRYTEFTTDGINLNLQREDSAGNTVWGYEWFSGWHTGADYTNTTQQAQVLNWSPQRWGSTTASVNVSPWDQNTNYQNTFSTHGVSLTRWTNPTGDGANISINGALQLIWGGPMVNGSFTTHPLDTLLLMGVHDASTNTFTLLINNLIDSSPFNSGSCNSSSYGQCPNVTTPLNYGVNMDAGDSLFWTAIPVGAPSSDFRWISLVDKTMSITYTPVPLPTSMLLFLSGLLVLSWKKAKLAKQP